MLGVSLRQLRIDKVPLNVPVSCLQRNVGCITVFRDRDVLRLHVLVGVAWAERAFRREMRRGDVVMAWERRGVAGRSAAINRMLDSRSKQE